MDLPFGGSCVGLFKIIQRGTSTKRQKKKGVRIHFCLWSSSIDGLVAFSGVS